MIVDIFDVGHGACAAITSPNQKTLLIDCGHSVSPQFRPSQIFAGYPIEELVISNYDEDHVSDLPNVMARVPIRFIRTNTSVTAADLARLKMEYGAGPGIERLHRWMNSPSAVPGLAGPDFGPMRVTHYWNNYPGFDDENNLSIVTVAQWADFSIMFSGDLEKAGWRNLLTRQDFVNQLRNVTVFVASHHGRETGCCEEVFRICRPQIVVMSDRDKQFDSQETTPWYRARSTGVTEFGETRHVFTTRCDGHLRIRAWVSQFQTHWHIDSLSKLLKVS